MPAPNVMIRKVEYYNPDSKTRLQIHLLQEAILKWPFVTAFPEGVISHLGIWFVLCYSPSKNFLLLVVPCVWVCEAKSVTLASLLGC